ncbi:hypothetical protein D3C85_1295700 [compost metagenome]
MFRRLATAALITTTLTVMGCTSSPVDPSKVALGDYGDFPTNYQETVIGYFQQTLKDPYSAQYKFGTPYKGYLRDAPINGGEPTVFGYIVDCSVNAKNSYGGYTGDKHYRMFLKNNTATPFGTNPWFQESWYK